MSAEGCDITLVWACVLNDARTHVDDFPSTNQKVWRKICRSVKPSISTGPLESKNLIESGRDAIRSLTKEKNLTTKQSKTFIICSWQFTNHRSLTNSKANGYRDRWRKIWQAATWHEQISTRAGATTLPTRKNNLSAENWHGKSKETFGKV